MIQKRNPLLRKRRKKESVFKYSMALLHLWLGLLSSVVVFIVCLSGSIYAFKQQIEDWINSESLHVAHPYEDRVISSDTLLLRFEKRFGRPTTMWVYPESDRTVLISSLSREGAGVSAYFDPYTGNVVGVKNQNASAFFAWVLDLHRFLLAGDVGKFVNGTAVLMMVLMLVSGLVLWIPKNLKQLKKSLLIKWRAKLLRVNYDLHKVLGFYAALLLLFMAITGLYVSFTWVKNAVIVGLGGDSIIISESNLAIKAQLAQSFESAMGSLVTEQQSAGDSVASLSQVLTQAQSHFSSTGLLTINLPNENINNYTLTHLSAEGVLGFYTPDVLEFSPSGDLRKLVHFSDLPLHEQFKAIAKPLHTGEIMGLPSIIFYFIASLIGCSLPVTGFIIWWRRV